MRRISPAIGALGLGLLLAGSAAAAEDKDWPCDQILQPELSVGAMWSGPDPSGATESWQNDESVRSLVERIAPRRVALDEARSEIRQFAAGVAGNKRKALVELFAGLFETINSERGEIIRGIKRYHGRQAALAKRIEDTTKTLDDLDPDSKDQAVIQKRADIQTELDWDSRIFDDRQRLLPAVCEQPVLLERRLFALSRTIQDELGK
jgi:hypothetical protein